EASSSTITSSPFIICSSSSSVPPPPPPKKLQDVLNVHPTAATSPTLGLELLQPLLAIPVIDLPLLLIRQDLISFVDLGESLGGLLVVGILVGVVLEGELAVRPLDLILRRSLGHLQHVVVAL
uniref:Uncharacterized protein n=1 Tax=Oryza brachyantha TaxID=4533 RepID=J3M450_ORYBR